MTLIIQRAEHRDTQAIHAKLDELLRAEGRARSELTMLDDEEPEVIEAHRAEERGERLVAGQAVGPETEPAAAGAWLVLSRPAG